MEAISADVARKFCEICNWAYESWATHKHLFDDNEILEDTMGKCKHFAHRLSFITQEYSILQLTKLHDPAITGRSVNISIEYMVEFGSWGGDERKVRDLQEKLNALFKILRSARNKVICHNDMVAFVEDKPVGAFTEGLDNEYFHTLQNLVNAVSTKWLGQQIYPFNDLAAADAKEFLYLLGKA
jgi:hypothetical protein